MSDRVDYLLSGMHGGCRYDDIESIIDCVVDGDRALIVKHYLAHVCQKMYFDGYREGKERRSE